MAKSVKHKKSNITPPIPQIGDSRTAEHLMKRTRKIALSGWPMILGWLAMLIFTFHACTRMVAAGDTWVAMACGRHFSNHGVDTVEPFSANSHKAGPTEEEIKTWPNWAQWITNKVGIETVKKLHPTGWINQNWLAHEIFYKLVPKSSYADGVSFTSNALVYWKFAIYVITVICIYYTSRLLGVHPALSAVFACFAMFIGRSFLDVRPAGFSNMLVAVFLLILTLTIYRNYLFIWLLVPIVIFWCNVHGGYIYAFIMLVPFIGLQLIITLIRTRNLIPALFSFSGRMRRKDYWLKGFLVLFPISIINNVLALNEKTIIFSYIISIFLIWVLFALYTKRLHDRNRSGWWLATLFIPLANVIVAIWIIIEVWFLRGTIGPNRFGDDPITESNEISKFMGNKDTLKSIGPIGLYHIIAAYIVTFIGIILFNPFHLTNLTHTFVISMSEHAARWRQIHEWQPAFEWTNPVGTAVPFLVMYIMLWLLIVFWLLAMFKILRSDSQYTKRSNKSTVQYQWPKINIVLIIIAALTVYMAIRSRRFIPIAAIAACPLIAFLIQELVRYLMSLVSVHKCGSITSLLNEYVCNVLIIGIAAGLIIIGLWQLLLSRWLFYPIPDDPEGRLQPRIVLFVLGVLLAYVVLFLSVLLYPINRDGGKTQVRDVQLRLIFSKVTLVARLVIFAFVVGFGIWFTAKFNRVYLAPWPNDPKYSSVFMRMTASDAKPFYAMKFIRDNKLSGKMLNYWTEGGFIAWGQEPDPNTGRTPLQLFMDGRAQAAYNRRAFDLWSYVMSGGQITYDKILATRARGQDITPADYREIGKWMDQQLTDLNVWLVMMPSAVYNDPDQNNYYHATRGIEHDPNWPLVFCNNKQRIYVNVRTPRGEELFQGIFTGKSLYPDDFHKNLIRAHSWFLYYHPDPEKRKEGLKYAIDAFHEKPSPAPMLEIILNATRFNELQPEVNQFCADYVRQFQDNRQNWLKLDGYRQRIEAARLAGFHLEQDARRRRNTELVNSYAALQAECIDQLVRITIGMKW